jgi:hypothetical protein
MNQTGEIPRASAFRCVFGNRVLETCFKPEVIKKRSAGNISVHWD